MISLSKRPVATVIKPDDIHKCLFGCGYLFLPHQYLHRCGEGTLVQEGSDHAGGRNNVRGRKFLGSRFWLKIGCLAMKEVVLCGNESSVTGGVQAPIREPAEGMPCAG